MTMLYHVFGIVGCGCLRKRQYASEQKASARPALPAGLLKRI